MRPHIICHMMTSIDGKLHPSRFSDPAPGASRTALLASYESVADTLQADGWIVGRKTMAEMAKGTARAASSSMTYPRETHVAERGQRKIAVAIDPSGRVHYGKDNVTGDHVVAVLGTGVSDDYLAELRADGASYVFSGADGRDLEATLRSLAEDFGAARLLLEGGGSINGAFLKAGLIDEFSTLIMPAVDGLAGVQSIVDYHGLADERPGAGQTLLLNHLEALEGGVV